ncbi:hypothetical protein PFISCL1PPCAC_11920, partial [Pristionchus fissidentatus]
LISETMESLHEHGRIFHAAIGNRYFKVSNKRPIQPFRCLFWFPALQMLYVDHQRYHAILYIEVQVVQNSFPGPSLEPCDPIASSGKVGA